MISMLKITTSQWIEPEALAMRTSVLNNRPSPNTLYWDFPAEWKASSSPITKRRPAPTDKIETICVALTGRLEDIKEANKNLKNGLIIDIFIDEKGIATII